MAASRVGPRRPSDAGAAAAGPSATSGRRRSGGGGPAASAARPAQRLFNAEIGGQITWLLPAALILLGRRPVVDAPALRDRPASRAALLLWGGWTVVSALVFSLMEGTFHAYYTVALAPGVAALVAIGAREAWRVRDTWTGRGVLALATAVTAVWAWVLLGRSATFLPWLRWVVLAVGAVRRSRCSCRRGGAGSPGASRRSSPVRRCSPGWPDRRRTPCRRPRPRTRAASCRRGRARDQRSDRAGGCAAGRTAVRAARPGGDRAGRAGPGARGRTGRRRHTGRAGLRTGRPRERATGTALAALLTSADTRWAAATTGSQGAASMELSTGTAVMAIGGFVGSDPYPTLQQFQQYVANGEIHYFVEGGGAGPGRRDSEIATWVRQHYSAQTVDGRTVYDLTAPAS